MVDFTLRFFLVNIVISVMTGGLLALRQLLKNCLTCRTRYHLWFLLLGALSLPFLPLSGISRVNFWLDNLDIFSRSSGTVLPEKPSLPAAGAADWMTDFGLSAADRSGTPLGAILCALWITGILFASIRLFTSFFHLHTIRKSALPLQSPLVRSLYGKCLGEMKIRSPLPLYGTAFLSSPMLAGVFRPCIYLPLRLVSDLHAGSLGEKELRFMLLHELQHFKHRDLIANIWINLAYVLYWFNPIVRYALKEMRSDREIACDASVLQTLCEEDYRDYGNTLINYAEKLSRAPFPFAAGLGGSMTQMKKRIRHIAGYRPVSPGKLLGSRLVFLCIALLLSLFAPALSTGARTPDRYAFDQRSLSVTYADYRSFFGDNKGSFVLFEANRDAWTIYEPDEAVRRVPPASTYKIYAALHALESGVITPEQSLLSWDGTPYPFQTWNEDQTLESAMNHSVNWYFQSLDRQTGADSVKAFIREIGYGNQAPGEDLSAYWYDSSLKISPVEQVELLRKLHDGVLPFSPENRQAVQNSLCLAVSEKGALYGKTGTLSAEGKNTSGWFIGFIESENGTCYFAVNIQNEDNAGGSAAAEITLAILTHLGLWIP